MDRNNDVSSYVKILDAIQKKCQERNRTAVSVMAINMGKIEKQATNRSVSNLESLKLLYFEADSFANASEAKHVYCLDVVSHWKQQNQQIAQQEAEDKKQE
jgi:hypothetical protein